MGVRRCYGRGGPADRPRRRARAAHRHPGTVPADDPGKGTLTTTDARTDDPTLVVDLDLTTGLVHLRGDLDRDSAHHLRDAVETLLVTDRVGWTIDAGQVTFCDAGGLRALTAAARTAAAAGRELRLGVAPRCVTRLLALTGQTGLFSDSAPPSSARPYRVPAPSRPAETGLTDHARHTVLR